MKLHIDFTQPSTVRGSIWAVAGIIGTIGYLSGFDPMPIITLAGALSGGLGVAISDNK